MNCILTVGTKGETIGLGGYLAIKTYFFIRLSSSLQIKKTWFCLTAQLGMVFGLAVTQTTFADPLQGKKPKIELDRITVQEPVRIRGPLRKLVCNVLFTKLGNESRKAQVILRDEQFAGPKGWFNGTQTWGDTEIGRAHV